MLHFRRSDAERQRTKSAVGAGMAVAADDGHARLSEAQLGADHVYDALVGRIKIEERDSEFFAIALQSLDLQPGNRIENRSAAWLGGDVVVDRREGSLRLPDQAVSDAQAIEGLRRSDFVHQMEIDIKKRQAVVGNANYVLVPDLVEECAWVCHSCLVVGRSSSVVGRLK